MKNMLNLKSKKFNNKVNNKVLKMKNKHKLNLEKL